MIFPHAIGGHSRYRPVLATSGFILFLLIFAGNSAGQAPAASSPAAPSGLRLVGTVEGAPFSGAVLDDGAGGQTFYGLHDALPDGSQIIKVNSDSIVVRQTDGASYELFTNGGKVQSVPGTPLIDGPPTRPGDLQSESGPRVKRPSRRGRGSTGYQDE